MKKWIVIPLLTLLVSVLGHATVVTGTVTDSSSQAWYGGTYDFQLQPPGVIYSGGVPLPTNSYHFRGVLDGSGAFSITIPDNTTLAPAGTYWRVTICSQTSSPVETTGGSKKDTCYYVDVTVSGVSQSLSSVLSAAAPVPLVNGLLTPFAYSQAELQLVINGLMPGSVYWDLGATCLKVWNGSSWNCLGGGGSGTVTSITGLSPIVASPNPITGVGTIGCPTCVTSNPVSLTATSPIVITPSPTVGVGVISCPTCGVGTATVSSFSAGDLSPLFTTSVATPTTTPALTFTLSNAAANTIFGNFTGGSAAPIYNAISGCGDSSHAVKYTAGTGFGCQAISFTQNHGISFTIGDPAGSVLTVAATTTDYVTVPFACTIAAYNLNLAPSGTITVKFWKVATGTAIPTSGNSISTSGVGISSGTAIHSTTLSDFTTTTVSANDIIAMNVTAIATASYINGVLECNQ